MSALPSENPANDLSQFFDDMWGDETGYVYLPHKNPKTSEWKKVMFPWPRAKQRAIEHVTIKSAEGHDVYFAPVVFSDARPVKENFKSSRVVWADFDGNAPASWSTEAEQAAQTSPAAPSVPPPSLRVQSSKPGREHVYWFLDERTTDSKFVENTNQAIAYTFKADLGGWDLVQVLRPPGTLNYKGAGDPVEVLHKSKKEYNIAAFSTLRPVKQLVSESIEITDVPDVAWVLAKYPWDEIHHEVFKQQMPPVGERSAALMRLGYFGAESGMEDAEIYSVLLNADDRWGKFKNRADRHKRFIEIINRARHKYPTGGVQADAILGLANSTAPVENPQYVFGFQEFLDSEINIEWAFENLIDLTGLGILAAAPAVGKTQLSIQMGIAAALGKPFLQWEATREMRIVFFSLEMPHAPLKYFMEQISKQYTGAELALLEKNFKVIPLGEAVGFDTPQGKKFVELILDEYQPDGVIIDSMGKVTNKTLTDENLIKELTQYYNMLRKKYECFLWFIHHNRKASDNNKKPRDLSDLYGSQYLAADASVVLSLWKDDKGIELSAVKTRLAAQPPAVMLSRNENLHFTMVEREMTENLLRHVGKEDGDDRSGPPFNF